ncbi:MAG: hypothetical protein M1837_003492 [Sclerophora amabilis]|nr:MAG: hypothetical protein M1837_003492 [Sclerophora amabilis]
MSESGHVMVPPPSIGHEIGVLFGFVGLNLVGVACFWAWWVWKNKIEDRHETARKEELSSRGFTPNMSTSRGAAGDTTNGESWGKEKVTEIS